MKILFSIIKNLPLIISFIREIEKLITNISVNQKKKEMWQSLTLAAKKSRESGDTTDLEDALKGLSKKST